MNAPISALLLVLLVVPAEAATGEYAREGDACGTLIANGKKNFRDCEAGTRCRRPRGSRAGTCVEALPLGRLSRPPRPSDTAPRFRRTMRSHARRQSVRRRKRKHRRVRKHRSPKKKRSTKSSPKKKKRKPRK